MASKVSPVTELCSRVCEVWAGGAGRPRFQPRHFLVIDHGLQISPTIKKAVLTRELGKASHPETPKIQVGGLTRPERSRMGPSGGGTECDR